MTLDLTSAIAKEFEGFGFFLASKTIALIGDRLHLPTKDRLAMDEVLRPVIEGMGTTIIQPALVEELLKKFTPNARLYQKPFMVKLIKKLENDARNKIGTHLAEAILPDVQNPDLRNNAPAFRAALSDVAEGLGAASQEEIMDAVRTIIQDVFHPKPSSAVITPGQAIKPDEHTRILNMISDVELASDTYIRLHFDASKLQPKDREMGLSRSLMRDVSQIVDEIVGISERSSLLISSDTRPSCLLCEVGSVKHRFSAQQVLDKIMDAVQEAKNLSGWSR